MPCLKLLLIIAQEISQLVCRAFQLFQIGQIDNAEMVRLPPVKSFAVGEEHLLLFQKVQDKLLIIQNFVSIFGKM